MAVRCDQALFFPARRSVRLAYAFMSLWLAREGALRGVQKDALFLCAAGALVF